MDKNGTKYERERKVTMIDIIAHVWDQQPELCFYLSWTIIGEEEFIIHVIKVFPTKMNQS